MSDEFWPEKERYRAAIPEPKAMPRCSACGSAHDKPTPWCDRTPQEETTDGRRPEQLRSARDL